MSQPNTNTLEVDNVIADKNKNGEENFDGDLGQYQKNPSTHFTEPTTTYWQSILPSTHTPQNLPYKFSYPASLPDTRFLLLPIRPLASNPKHAVASLLVNQASMDVVDILSDFLGDLVLSFAPEVIIGLPTLGLTLAPLVARRLGLGKLYILQYYSFMEIKDQKP